LYGYHNLIWFDKKGSKIVDFECLLNKNSLPMESYLGDPSGTINLNQSGITKIKIHALNAFKYGLLPSETK
jgi:hypothetical protein